MLACACKYIIDFFLFMFSEILRATGTYSDQDLLLFEREVLLRQVGKNEILLGQGEIARSMFLILKGAVVEYRVKSETERDIIDLHLGGEWCTNYKSLIGQKPSESFIKTSAESTIIELTLDSVHYLTGKSLAFMQLNKILEGAMSRLDFFDNSMTPLEKYQFVLNKRPQLIQVFPLKMIASYLKVTPETLSRVREKLARGRDVS
jgi:CRP-like cAMP-binding protein